MTAGNEWHRSLIREQLIHRNDNKSDELFNSLQEWGTVLRKSNKDDGGRGETHSGI